MSPSSEAETQVYRAALDAVFCDVLANPHLHLERKVDLERNPEIWDPRFSGF